MLDRILPNLNIKSIAQQDETIVSDIVKKSKPVNKDKERDDAFNCLVEERINEEKNQLQLRKKVKKHEDINVLYMPIYNQNIPMIQNHYLVKFKKDGKHKCSRCGNIVDNDQAVEVNQKGSSVYVCSKCMNKEIKDFLTYNYL